MTELGTVVPAIATTPWLWPIGITLLVGVAVTDRRVQWQKRPGLGRNDMLAAAAELVVGVPSMVTGATLPAGGSVLWPLLGFAIMAAALALRVEATRLLGTDFNGDLRTRPGQAVVDAGPYRWVRHPGYLAAGAIVTGFMVIIAYWPLVLVAAVLLGVSLRGRIAKEEPINREGIAGYNEYMRRVRWRIIPGVW